MFIIRLLLDDSENLHSIFKNGILSNPCMWLNLGFQLAHQSGRLAGNLTSPLNTFITRKSGERRNMKVHNEDLPLFSVHLISTASSGLHLFVT